MRKRITSLIRSSAVALAVSAGFVATSAAPADAWSAGNVWINFGSWNCPAGGNVTGVYWAVDNYSVGPATGDWGDNVIYPSVRVGSGARNTISYALFCNRPWYRGGGYFVPGQQRVLTPYKSGLSYTY